MKSRVYFATVYIWMILGTNTYAESFAEPDALRDEQAVNTLVTIGLKTSEVGHLDISFFKYDPDTGKVDRFGKAFRSEKWDPHLPRKFQLIETTLPEGHWFMASATIIPRPSTNSEFLINSKDLRRRTIGFEVKKGSPSFLGNYKIESNGNTESGAYFDGTALQPPTYLHRSIEGSAAIKKLNSNNNDLTTKIEDAVIVWVTSKCLRRDKQGKCNLHGMLPATK